MAEVNIYYHKQTNTWWTNSKLDGIYLSNYIKENPIGLGHIETNTDDIFVLRKLYKDELYEVDSFFIPQYLKSFNGVAQDILENGFENAEKVTSRKQLKRILKNK